MIAKIKSLSPLHTYIVGGILAIVAGFFRDSNVFVYYAILLVAMFFCVYAMLKYFKK